VKAALSTLKFRYARKLYSAALEADAWNDTVDILSAFVALAALGLTLADPQRFLTFDHYGGFAVGVIVLFLAMRIVRESTLQLMDTMPEASALEEIRRVAMTAPGAMGVEKCFARKTGLRYHVDLHLEVDENMTVKDSHDVATEVRIRIKEQLEWVADVLVHVEPHTMGRTGGDGSHGKS
jgi:cation diffusion facilitator family transporter